MAGKSRRVASRQGELGRRRKRGQRGPSGIPAAAPARPQQNGDSTAVAVEPARTTVATASAESSPAPAPRPVAAPARAPATNRAQGRARGERPAAYNYVGAELRRIGILSTVMVAALVVIAVVL